MRNSITVVLLLIWISFQAHCQQTYMSVLRYGLFHPDERSDVDSVYSMLEELYFHKSDSIKPTALRDYVVYAGGGSVQPIYPVLPRDLELDSLWLEATFNGEMELFMGWNDSFDTAFVTSFSPICHNPPRFYDRYPRAISSDLIGAGFAPTVRWPYSRSTLEKLPPNSRQLLNEHLFKVFRGSTNAQSIDSVDFLVDAVLDTNGLFLFEPNSINDLIRLFYSEGILSLYEDISLKKELNQIDVDTTWNWSGVQQLRGYDDDIVVEVERIITNQRIDVAVIDKFHFDELPGTYEYYGVDYYFIHRPYALQLTLQSGKRLNVETEEFLNGCKKLGYDAELFNSFFKAAILRKFNINKFD